MLKDWVALRNLCMRVIINSCSTNMSKKNSPRGAKSPTRGSSNGQDVGDKPDESGSRAPNSPAAAAVGSARNDRKDGQENRGLRDSFLEMRDTFQKIRPLLENSLGQSTPRSREDAHGDARRPPRGSASAGKCRQVHASARMYSMIAHAILRNFAKF